MKTSDYIALTIDRFPRGYVFTSADFSIEVNKKEAVIKALNRMVLSGKIQKVSKGKYYKPENTPFGFLKPNQAQIVKDLLEEKDKIVGYLTGYAIFNAFGLTTQMSNTIQIGKNHVRPSIKRGMFTIRFIKQKNTITKNNIPLLQLLDTIRFIKIIPDSTVEISCKRLIFLLSKLSEKEISTMVRLALQYPPSTRALLGAILEHLHKETELDKLFKTINPITKYKLTDAQKVLSTTQKWNII